MRNRTRRASQRCGPRRVIFLGVVFMSKKEHPVALSVEEQIRNLDRINLQISNSQYASDFLEVNLQCRVAHYFSLKCGVLGYECSNNFANPEYHKEFLDDVSDAIKRNRRSPFVRNFQQNYLDGKILMYALVELLSFGTLSKYVPFTSHGYMLEFIFGSFKDCYRKSSLCKFNNNGISGQLE